MHSDFPPGNDRQSYAFKVRQVFDGAIERADLRDDDEWYSALVAAKELWETEYLPDCGDAKSMLLGAIDASLEAEADRFGFVEQWARTLGAIVGSDGGPAAIVMAAEAKRPTTRDVARTAAMTLLGSPVESSKARRFASILVAGAVENEFAEAVEMIAAEDNGLSARIARDALTRAKQLPDRQLPKPTRSDAVETLDLAERAVHAAQKAVHTVERMATVAEVAAASGEKIAKAATRGATALGDGVAAVLNEVDKGFDAADEIATRAERTLRRARRRDR